jgi:serine/threonine-protein kinase
LGEATNGSAAAITPIPDAAAHEGAQGGPDPLIGRMINDRYKVIALIARGGMGKVYSGEQAPLGRKVALKVLHPNYQGGHDPDFHRRFFLEAATCAKLTHPNTVTIYDYGRTDDDIYYIAMELLEGRTLHRALREDGPIAPARALHIARQVCRSLREAHAIRVVHRDLKPANVFLCRRDDDSDFVKVLDFGLVKNTEETAEDLTQTGLFMGSPKYMAPEQIQGERADGRVDIYALGVILYEMLTGKVPFDRPNSVNILMAHVHDAPPPFDHINPEHQIPRALEAVVLRCLAKQPTDRFATMDQVLAALKELDEGSMVSSSLTLSGAGPAPDRSGPMVRSLGSSDVSLPSVTPSGVLPLAGVSQGLPAVTVTTNSVPPPSAARPVWVYAVAALAAVGLVVGGVVASGGLSPATTSVQEPATVTDVAAGTGTAGAGMATTGTGTTGTGATGAGTTGAGTTGAGTTGAGTTGAGTTGAGTTGAGTTGAGTTGTGTTGTGTTGTGTTGTGTTGTGAADRSGTTGSGETPMARVRVLITSTPAGALVRLGDRRLGTTPLDLELSGDEARRGTELTFTVSAASHQTATLRRTIEGAELSIDTRLTRRSAGGRGGGEQTHVQGYRDDPYAEP